MPPPFCVLLVQEVIVMVDKLVLMDEYLLQGLWREKFDEIARLVGVTIKVEPLGYLAVFKATGAEGPVVAFKTFRSLEEIYRSLKSTEGRASLRWRPDKFMLDKYAKSE